MRKNGIGSRNNQVYAQECLRARMSMRKNVGYAQSRLRVARGYQPLAFLPNVVRRVALIPSDLGPVVEARFRRKRGCYDAYQQIIAADCAAHVRKKSGARQKSSPFGE